MRYAISMVISIEYTKLYSITPLANSFTSGSSPAIRLMSNRRDTTSEGRGRVELKVNGQYVTVCDDGFNVNAARTVCAHLGLSRGEVRGV